jgi:hypothetical protein
MEECAMTANLLTLTREKRAFPMKRLLMPATALTTLKKVAFTLLCFTMLMVFSASAQTFQITKTDPGTNNPPPAGAILDLNGTAIPGGGNETYKQYTVNFTASAANTVCSDGCKTTITFAFRDDPAQISFASASVVDLTTLSGNLLFNGDFSGGVYLNNGNSTTPIGWTYANMYGAQAGGGVENGSGYCYTYAYCWFDGAVQAYDAISQKIATNIGDTYEISFYVAEDSAIVANADNTCCGYPPSYSGSPCWDTVHQEGYSGPPCIFSDLSTNGDASDPGGNGINVTVYAQTGLPPATQLTVTELGTGTGTVTDNQNPQQINCGEANGYPSGTCTGTYLSSIGSVTLTATPNATPSSPSNPNGSAFLQWGGACASIGTTTPPYTCTVSVTSSQSVTADFIPIPTPVPFTLAGTNATAQAIYACPTGSNPCTDTNAYAMSVQFPAVTPTFGGTSLYILATEVYATGICPQGQFSYYGMGYPTGPTTDFDCRLAYSFNYGQDVGGDYVVPLCNAYANGNCVHYLVYYGTPGTVPPTNLYTGPVFETITYNNPSTPGATSFWNGSIPRTIVDPDADEATPSVPWGTNCNDAMNMEATSSTGVSDPYSSTGYSTPTTNPAIYCQFDEDATTFYNTSAPVDGGSGSKTQQPNDFVVAFQPTVAPPTPNPNTPIPTAAAPQLAGMCVNGCTPPGSVSNGGTITFTEGTGGTFEVSITAGYPAPMLMEPAPLPAGLTFSAATGLVSGTPQDGTSGNYPITFTATNSAGSGMLTYTLTVNPAGTLTITASSASMTYGGTVPPITAASGSGFVNGDTLASLTTQPTCSTAATSASPVGSYASTCSGAVDTNYTMISYVNGTVTVKPAPGPVIITASSPSMTYGGTVPLITASYSGFVNGELATPTLPNCMTTATSASPVGSYPTTCSGAADANYSMISYMSGTLMVNPAPLIITASSPTITYGTTPVITPIYSGLENGHNPSTPPNCMTTATSTSLPGTYPSTCSGAADPNYSPISYVGGTVTVVGLDVSPLTVNFGNLYLDQIGVQGVILKNTTTGPITINSITLGGGSANGDFGDVALCPPMILKLPATLPAGKSCAIGVGILARAKVFNPNPSTTYMTINDSAATQTVLLTAMVTDPVVSLSTTSLSFGNEKTGTTSVAQKVTLTNSGLTPLTLTGLTINGNFALTSGAGTNCTSSTVLSPGAPCYIYVNFTPTSKGTKYSGSVTITDLTLSRKQTISLSGSGD